MGESMGTKDHTGALKNIISEINQKTELNVFIRNILEFIKKLTEIEAISIRLHHEGDYPYFGYNGFDKEFIAHENSLCETDDDGNILLETDSKDFLLACMCGNIIRGKTDTTLEFFSNNGSFYSNHTSKLLETTTEEERQAHTRNYCNSCGYESVALIPIRVNDKIVGLIQLNDHRTDMFTDELIKFLEITGVVLGNGISKYSEFKEFLREPSFFNREFNLKICSHCKSIQIENDDWITLDEYFSSLENIHTRDLILSIEMCVPCRNQVVLENELTSRNT